jgi:hypothetical protein
VHKAHVLKDVSSTLEVSKKAASKAENSTADDRKPRLFALRYLALMLLALQRTGNIMVEVSVM